ncbi:MAG TPA: Gfo/Idh/MocA family oxidoreductase [Verrucomicrobiota bacterium]|nr:oxidoreductase [Verrucomicrobiales bacterium]HRI12710.1 Gfo/Idh/MocA family oxidoreductase [Verrucomicrobiota bacterium]
MSLRLGLIGLGNIGRHHAAYLLDGKVPRCELVAVCNPTLARLEPYRTRGLKVFTDPHELIQSGVVDSVLIATPHYQHTALGIAALEAGLHVMVEKPISAHKADAERLLAAAASRPELILAGMFQLRVEPRYAKIRALLAGGDLGQIQRVTWINTDWFRTETYYASGGWRATWRGEGGGVLLNQCLHNLDVLAWLLGLPARVRGFCQFGRWHRIEVEDQVTAYFEYANGATGTFLSSTGEAPGTNRFEIAGSRGRVVLENNRLTFTRNEADALDWSRTVNIGFSKPDVWNIEIPFSDAATPHATLMQNFVAAVLDGAPLIASGADGLHSVELANAITFSSLLGQTLELPLDGAAWERKLAELGASSKLTKEIRTVVTDDFAASFRR